MRRAKARQDGEVRTQEAVGRSGLPHAGQIGSETKPGPLPERFPAKRPRKRGKTWFTKSDPLDWKRQRLIYLRFGISLVHRAVMKVNADGREAKIPADPDQRTCLRIVGGVGHELHGAKHLAGRCRHRCRESRLRAPTFSSGDGKQLFDPRMQDCVDPAKADWRDFRGGPARQRNGRLSPGPAGESWSLGRADAAPHLGHFEPGKEPRFDLVHDQSKDNGRSQNARDNRWRKRRHHDSAERQRADYQEVNHA